MDKKKEHLKKIQELKTKIKNNSKDARFTGSLINELLLEQKQLSIEPLNTYDLGVELDRLEGDTFYIAKHERGALYHARNNYELVVQPSNTSLYETLIDLVDNKDKYNAYVGEEKETFDSFISAFAYILNLPTFVFSDVTFMFDVAKLIVTFLREKYDALMEEPLQEETIQEDVEFKQATLAMEELKQASKEE